MKRLILLGCAFIGPWTASLGCANEGPSADTVCSDEENCGESESETLAGDGDGDAGDGDGDSGDGDGDSGDGDGDGDGDSGDGDGDGDGDSGDGDGDPGNVTYDAVAQPGGLDRVFVRRHDPSTDTCTRMVLVTPLDLQNFAVTLPMAWSIESVANHQPADCSVLDAPEWIESGTGTVEFNGFDMLGVFPCAIDIDIVFDVAGDPPTLDFQTMDLDVADAC